MHFHKLAHARTRTRTLKKHSLQGQIIWITGATSGIGLSLTTQLLAEGASVVASGRHIDPLIELQSHLEDGQQLKICEVDVRDQFALAESLKNAEVDHLDIIVLNAGICQMTEPQALSAKNFVENMTTNYFGMMHSLEVALPYLKQAKKPGVVVNCSLSAFLPLNRFAAYGASKAAIRYAFEALRADLKDQGISLSLVHPGYVKTPIVDQFDFPLHFMVSAEQTAKKFIQVIQKRTPECGFPAHVYWMTKLSAYLPRFLRSRIGQYTLTGPTSGLEKSSS